MPHVREGEMHAYLDGALDRLGEETARRVRDHLSTCEDCQALMEQERALRESAVALLDRALPREITPPPFEELRRRALVGEPKAPQAEDVAAASPATAPPVPGSLRPRRRFSTWTWAWAASLVMALGTGWMIGGGSLDFRDAPRMVVEGASDEVSEEALSGTAVPAGTPAEAPLRSADEAVPASEPVVEAEEDREAPSAQLGVVARREAPTLDRSDRDVATDVAADVSADIEVVPLDRLQARTGAVSELAAAAGARLDSAPAGPLPVPAAAAFEDAPEELLESAAPNGPVAADGGPMVFEAAPVTAALPLPQTGGGQAILQQLPTGDSVLLVWVGESVNSESFAAWVSAAVPSPDAEDFRARRAPVRQLQPSGAPAVELRRANEAFALGRSEPWPTTVRISRGVDLLTVYSTASEADLRQALTEAGLMPAG